MPMLHWAKVVYDTELRELETVMHDLRLSKPINLAVSNAWPPPSMSIFRLAVLTLR